MTRVIPQCGIDLIRQFEGCELTAYKDTGGKWTIGWGHTGPDVYAGLTITQDIADELQVSDIRWAQSAIDSIVTAALNDNQDGALLSFVYNLGRGSLATSTLLRLVNAGNYSGAANEFPKWDHINGVKSAGLLRRRLAEQALFNT